MPCPACVHGIEDVNTGVALLATRIFDSVRFSLDRTPLILEAALPAREPTPLFAGGTGTNVSRARLTVTPHLEGHTADLTGDLLLSGTLTYLSQGSRFQAPCSLVLPLSLNVATPADVLWPYDVTVHYSFFADRLTANPDGTLSGLTDGVVILYVTACVPLSLPEVGTIRFKNSENQEVSAPGNYASSVFYPVIPETP